ncbi:Crp/Fnr family transcriptional regulator [Dactylosporangium matsuzakiense]|uniref:Crp/Fnr family transcriptional regulator n=1 Tax=Dactylosporangium matsuzakiense TaxID=53360 RepID=A0A9W6NRE5_9ACTN|nr:Crp/Fnr family transcriptional regulator [Dactylosporangium matsuzakiense]UWZ44820.1 Crp/Fnr family transcriptional regulator [Dactylosporangium matsuzakiense]GLL06087.1 Crp/Fnr family transcriptional regulator [Dactylosporangium matsuzakiense]
MTEFFDLLHADEQAALEAAGHRRQWRRGAVIFREASRSEAVIILRAGRVKVSSDTASGTEVVLAVRGPGALIGELSAIDGGPMSATVTALEPVTALSVPSPDFERYLLGHARVSFLLMRELTRRLRDADRKRIEFGAYDTTGRVAARLVELAERFGENAPEGLRIGLPLSQDELAGWTGSSREAVTKALRTLREEGLIQTGRLHVIVHDLDALRDRAQ